MNENTQTVAAPESGGEARTAAKADESPGQSTTHDSSPDRGSIFDRLAGYFRQRNGSNLREDIVDALAESDVNGVQSFSPGERTMLNNILRLREVRVEDVMVPRVDIEAISIETTLSELLVLFEKSGHSRMPIYSESLDDPRGMVHIRDIVGHITRSSRVRKGRGKAAVNLPLNLAGVDLSKTVSELKLIRNVLFVPPSMLASDLMARMQATHTQIALVIDEYGGTDGLVSLEDLVEMVVGNIEDEHDTEEASVTQAADGSYIVDAKADIEEVAEKIGARFSVGEHSEYVDTIGGLVFNALGRVPTRGEVVRPIPGYEFHILEADPRRVKRVRISELPTSIEAAVDA